MEALRRVDGVVTGEEDITAGGNNVDVVVVVVYDDSGEDIDERLRFVRVVVVVVVVVLVVSASRLSSREMRRSLRTRRRDAAPRTVCMRWLVKVRMPARRRRMFHYDWRCVQKPHTFCTD